MAPTEIKPPGFASAHIRSRAKAGCSVVLRALSCMQQTGDADSKNKKG